MDHVYRGVEAMLDMRLDGSFGRIFADHKSDGTVSVDMVGTVLGIIFENEDSRIVPIGAVRNGVDHSPQSQIVIGHRCGGARPVGTRAPGVIIWKIEQHKGWKLKIIAFVRSSRTNVGPEFIQKFIGAELVGIVGVEVRKERVEVIAQHCLGGLDPLEQWHGPRPRTRDAMWITDIVGQHLPLFYIAARARSFQRRWSSLLRVCDLADLVAPFGVDIFAVIAVAKAVASHVVPQKTGRWIVDVGLVMIKWKLAGNRALKIVGSFFATIGDLPGFLVVIARDCSR